MVRVALIEVVCDRMTGVRHGWHWMGGWVDGGFFVACEDVRMWAAQTGKGRSGN